MLITAEKVAEYPAYPVEVVDTTCAGDAFAAGVLFGVSRRMSLDDSVRLGNACGDPLHYGDQPSWDYVVGSSPASDEREDGMIPRERRGLAHFSADLIVALRRRAKAEKCACPLAQVRRRGLAHFSADLIFALRRRARPKNVPVPLRKFERRGLAHFSADLIVALCRRAKAEKCACPLAQVRERRGLAHFSADLVFALRRRAKAEKCACPLAQVPASAGDWLIFRPI